MEDNNTPSNSSTNSSNPATTPAAGGQFMDIQASKSSGNGGSAPTLPADKTQGTPVNVVDSPTTIPGWEKKDNGTSLQSPVDDTVTDNSDPVSPVTDASSTVSPAAVTSADDEATPTNPDANPLAIPSQAPKKSGSPVLVIMIALVVGIGLAGLVVFTFIKSKNDKTASNKSSSSASQTATKPVASPADVDNVTKDLETSLSKIDDTKDFPATDLSDKSLGL